MTIQNLQVMSRQINKIILDLSLQAHVGHIGCSLSIADILSVLYGDFLSIPSFQSDKRDHFILSKGHAALGMYAALSIKGIISKKQIATYHTDGSQIGTHPEYGVNGVELATGSLGQGIGVSVGIALAKKLKGETSKTVVLLSDAECNEGSVWEAITFANHHQLNLIAIVDLNGQQGFGMTEDVMNMSPMADKWRAFGWSVFEVNGHDLEALQSTLVKMQKKAGPRVLLAHTTLGKGISFMERKVDWHYMPLTPEQYAQAIEELDTPQEKKKGKRA